MGNDRLERNLGLAARSELLRAFISNACLKAEEVATIKSADVTVVEVTNPSPTVFSSAGKELTCFLPHGFGRARAAGNDQLDAHNVIAHRRFDDDKRMTAVVFLSDQDYVVPGDDSIFRVRAILSLLLPNCSDRTIRSVSHTVDSWSDHLVESYSHAGIRVVRTVSPKWGPTIKLAEDVEAGDLVFE
jgi:hypothetical protein